MVRIDSATNAAASPPGSSRARSARLRGAPARGGRAGTYASRRGARPTRRDTSVVRRTRAGAARPADWSPRRRDGGSRTGPARGRGIRARAPRGRRHRRSAAPPHCSDTTFECTACTRRRSRSGSTCSSLTRAPSAVSSMPSIDARAAERAARPRWRRLRRRRAAGAGGARPAARRYPPPTPRASRRPDSRATRSRSTSRRRVRALTPRRVVSSAPGQNRWVCRRDRSRSARSVGSCSAMGAACSDEFAPPCGSGHLTRLPQIAVRI